MPGLPQRQPPGRQSWRAPRRQCPTASLAAKPAVGVRRSSNSRRQQYAEPPPQPVYAVPPPADESDKLDQLKQLGALKDQGVLTDAEFEVQKSRILNS